MAQAQFFKWRRINKETGEEEFSLVQGALRNSVLGVWEYIFPEEALADVISIFGITDTKLIGVDYKLKYVARLAFLRRILGATTIPKKIYEDAKKLPPSIMLNDSWRGLSNLSTIPGVSIHPIGIQKDSYGDMAGYHQELL